MFGRNADVVGAWVKKTNAAYGITTKALQDVTSRFGVFGKAAGIAAGDLPKFSTELAQAGLDLSSFYNVDPEEAFLALSSGLAGEAEPLRRFGIFLSDATMKAEAASMGLRGELTESQKVAVRQRLILKSLGDANGDLERTSDSLANKWRAVKGRATELATNLGRGLVPVAADLVNWLDGKLAPVSERLTANIDELRGAVSDAAGGKGFGRLAKVLDTIVGGNGRVERFINNTTTTLGRFIDTGKRLREGWRADGLDGLVDAMDGATGSSSGLESVARTVVDVGRDLVTIWKDGVQPAFEDLGPVVGGILSPLSLLDETTGFLADNADRLSPLLTMLVAGWAAYKVATTGLAAIQGAMTAATIAQALATGGFTAATAAATTAEWSLTAAMLANPIGLIVAGVAALVAGLVLLYQRSETFRNVVDAIGRAGKAAFGWLLNNWKSLALITLGGPIGAFVVLYQKVKPVRTVVDKIGDALQAVGRVTFGGLKAALRWIGDKLATLWNLAKKVVAPLESIGGFVGKGLNAVGIGGDTPRPRARGAHRGHGVGRALGHTLAVHNRIDGQTPGRRRITSAVRGHSLGSANSDHPAGKALDITGSNLNAYARNLRAAGGFAEHHGSGQARHLHAAIGDTPRPRSSSSSSSGGGDTYIDVAPGAIVVQSPATNLELDLAVAAGIRRFARERRERR